MGFVTVAFLSLVTAQTPLERGSGYEFALPRGWTRRTDEATKATILSPSESGDEVRLVLHPVVRDAPGTGREFHQSTCESVTARARTASDPLRGRWGGFRWTLVNLESRGSLRRTKVYTLKSGSTAAVAVLSAPPRLFDKPRVVVEQLLWDLKVDGVENPAWTVHGFLLQVPVDWTRNDDPAGAIELHPPAPESPQELHWPYMLLVLPTQPLRGTFWESHVAIFEEVVKGSGLVNTIAPKHDLDVAGPFVRSSTAGDDPQGTIRPLRLYSAPSEDGIDCIVVFPQEDFPTVGALLRRAKLRKPPKESSVPRIVEAYRRRAQQSYSVSVRGELHTIAVPYDRIWLRADGLADFAPIYEEGYAASRVPAKADSRVQNGRFGSWKAAGDEVHIVRNATKPVEVYVRKDGKLRLGDKVWEPMPSVDGLKLEGRWHLPGAAAETPPRKRRIGFTREGRFEDDGVLEDIGFYPVPAWPGSQEILLDRPPARGSGTYEIRDFTLLLRYDDGLVWSADFSTAGADPKDLSKLLLKSGELHREP